MNDKASDLCVDITWLMSKIDTLNILERLGVRVDKQRGNEIWGWCPDHKIFVGKEPSHPKWSINIKTGQTNCFTEPRGSNLVYIVCRLRKCDAKQAIEWILQGENFDLNLAVLDSMESEIERMQTTEKAKTPHDIENTIYSYANFIENESMNSRGYEYFISPPEKDPTNITKDTVDHYGCVCKSSGRYINRVIIPYFLGGKYFGFEARDFLGPKIWLKEHPGKADKDYDKVLFSYGLDKENYLFGYDDVRPGEPVFVTEGSREVMKLWQLGYNAVATCGTYIHYGQLMLLAKKNPSHIYVFYDGDVRGKERSSEVGKRVAEFYATSVIKTPIGKDPKNFDSRKEIDDLMLDSRRIKTKLD